MQDAPRPAQAAIRVDLGAIFISLELSRSTWVITSLSPGNGEKMSKHSVMARDVAGLVARFAQLKQKARARTGQDFPIIVVQEAGLDGFWIHRVLESNEIESYVVDPASILTSRRRRRAKTDKIDGGGRRPIRSTARRSSAPCWPTSATSRGCAPLSRCRHPRRRIGDGSAASARR